MNYKSFIRNILIVILFLNVTITFANTFKESLLESLSMEDAKVINRMKSKINFDLKSQLIGKWVSDDAYITFNADDTGVGGENDSKDGCQFTYTLTGNILEIRRKSGQSCDEDDGLKNTEFKIRFESGELFMAIMKNNKIDPEESEVKWTKSN